jgi:hypothetical protein
MRPDTVAPDRDFLAWGLHQSPVPHHKLAALRPDFLIISPPKTGSTWLAANLRSHPDTFIPKIKEVKYFGRYFRWMDFNWYLEQFAPGAGRVKGEASPSYAILPVERIRLIRSLMPGVKLLFLMRDPVSRAWSHAKHNYRYREANFSTGAGPLEGVSDAKWYANFAHEWTATSGDYLGQLRRWLSVFPREQMFIGFYESIAARPEALLREVFAFLGVSSDVELSAFPVRERVLPGLSADLSAPLTRLLQGLLGPRTRELASFLRESLGLEPPPEWDVSLRPSEAGAAPVPPAFTHEFDDDYLARVLAQEEQFPSSPTPILEGYRGHDVVFYRGRFFALAEGISELRVNETDEARLREHEAAGHCFIAPSLSELKESVDESLFLRFQEGLRAARAKAGRLEGRLRRLEAEVGRLTPWYAAVARWVRTAWHGRVTDGVDLDERCDGCRCGSPAGPEKPATG